MGAFRFDIRDAFRSIVRDRAYSATVVLTLALTVGATTAIFSIVNGVLLKPLAYRESQQLVAIQEIWRQFVDRMPTAPVNERHFNYWREHSTLFESMAQYIAVPANLTGVGEARQIVVVRSSGTLFDVLGAPAAVGRTLTAADEREERSAVTVLADAFWRKQFGADPGVVGRTITIDGRPVTIVGVLRPDFRLPNGSQLTAAIDAVVPLRLTAGWYGDHNNLAIGRLRAGVTIAQAQSELDVLQRQVSSTATTEAHETVTLASAVTPLAESIVGKARRGLLLLFGAIAGVLLIACSNLANLSLTRTLGRLRDAAIRSALGASRRRLVTRAVVEQLALSAIGGALGLWVAWAALALFVRTAPIDLPRVDDVALDGRVIGFAFALSLAAGLLVAMAPAWRIGSRDVQGTLRAGGAAAGSNRTASRTRTGLLALQIGLSVALLSVTGLLGLSFARLLTLDRGFVSERVLTVGISLPSVRYATEPVRQAVFDRMLGAVREQPGVVTVTVTSMLPLSGSGQNNFVMADGSTGPRAEQPTANFRFVAPEYFRTLGLPLRRGRSFTDGERDPARPAPVVISEPLADRLWPGRDPIGQRFSRGLGNEQGFEVVGVAADAHVTEIDRMPPLMVYVPYWWRTRPATSLMVKTAVGPASVAASVRRAIQAIDPEIAVGEARALDDIVAASMSGRRYQTQLFVVFGAVALFIATLGVYGTTNYSVTRRRREMNIRVALGARPGEAIGMVVRQEALPVAVGLAGGLAGAVALGGVVASLLFEVRARDPLVLTAVAGIVGMVGLGASVTAARQGLKLDPAAALRDE